ncbi:NADPH-dependent 2,4-dienoyl-CoA reductase/sulfur reductase-like enzyme [Pontibacter aydingkolensis]|uniref:FAD-dependent oxidoreductase n=1 Tax=Pontibacter aydingkolensis TaxID=1911536 RepID=A0ABS7CXF6_9BACT|nr:FAD-dependent oxidoreductase [Pontibacter aydingkolensis]MBW7468504.1 FAD-dependent oxidoreductase [Pontibacter aydingkolensis]
MQAAQHLVIIGNGVAGVTLAQHVRAKSTCRITLVSAESATHFSRPALMYVYMGHMRYKDILPYPDWYWSKNNLNQLHDKVTSVNFETKTLTLQKGEPVQYDVLVLATGSCPAFYNWPGQNLKGVQGLVTLQDLQSMEDNTKDIKEAVVVGGGLIGIEMAEMLRSRGIAVTMLVRELHYWYSVLPKQEAILVSDIIRKHGINLIFEDELASINPDAQGGVESITTKRGKQLTCQFVGIATGVKPNVSFLNNSGLNIDKGILVDEAFATNQPDVYAIGDCAQFNNPAPLAPAVEQLWYTARQHGETLAQTLTGTRQKYDRGPWFNSAKFLDIEYQTYGYVPATWDEKYGSLYWEHTAGYKAIRFLFEQDSGLLTGINLLGIRYRHDLCHHWLKQQYTIHQVMQELPAVNFDPEFFQHYEQELFIQYAAQFPAQATPPTKSNWWQLRKKFGLFSSSESC